MSEPMRVECLYSPGCGSAEPTTKLVNAVLEEMSIEAVVSTRVVANEQAAEKQGYLGSPTVRVNARDVDPSASDRQDFGLG